MADLKRLDLNLLLLFEALWQARSVSGAARLLGIGQPAASAALGRLRSALEDELFLRAGTRMWPTPRAEALAPQIIDALDRVRGALDGAGQFDPARSERRFTIAVSEYVGHIILPPLLGRLRREAPSVTLVALAYGKDDLPGLLARGQVDAGFGVFDPPPEDAVVTPLFQEDFVGLADPGHPILTSLPVTPAAYAAAPHALVSLRGDMTGYVDRLLAGFGLERRVTVALPYAFALGEALRGTDLIAAVPRRAARRLAERGLAVFDLPFAAAPWTVSLLWNPALRSDPAHAWFRSTILRCVQD